MHKTAPTAWQPVHYADLLEDSTRGRLTSRIAGLRLANNEVKRKLIEDASRNFRGSTLRVVDLCCGRGGDVGKFVHQAQVCGVPLSYVGADVTVEQIAAARLRVSQSSSIKWMVADCFSEDTARAIVAELGGRADIVSCQFAMHYAFRDSNTLSKLLESVAILCAPGASFIFTTTDSDMIVEYATQEQHRDAVCSVQLDDRLPDGPFGAGITFKLDTRVNDKEWLVHQPTLHAELARRRFVRGRMENLQHYAHVRNVPQLIPSLKHEDWAICRLYIVGHYTAALTTPSCVRAMGHAEGAPLRD